MHPHPNFPGYDLAHPTASDELPEILIEVSGLTDIDHRTIACVQDEPGGRVFL